MDSKEVEIKSKAVTEKLQSLAGPNNNVLVQLLFAFDIVRQIENGEEKLGNFNKPSYDKSVKLLSGVGFYPIPPEYNYKK